MHGAGYADTNDAPSSAFGTFSPAWAGEKGFVCAAQPGTPAFHSYRTISPYVLIWSGTEAGSPTTTIASFPGSMYVCASR